jgi:hypothetical protein
MKKKFILTLQIMFIIFSLGLSIATCFGIYSDIITYIAIEKEYSKTIQPSKKTPSWFLDQNPQRNI